MRHSIVGELRSRVRSLERALAAEQAEVPRYPGLADALCAARRRRVARMRGATDEEIALISAPLKYATPYGLTRAELDKFERGMRAAARARLARLARMRGEDASTTLSNPNPVGTA